MVFDVKKCFGFSTGILLALRKKVTFCSVQAYRTVNLHPIVLLYSLTVTFLSVVLYQGNIKLLSRHSMSFL